MLPAHDEADSEAAARAMVAAYHARTKHRFEAFARGPEALDWDAQPEPFRRYAGVPERLLPLLDEAPEDLARALARPFGTPLDAPLPLALENLAALLQLSLGVTAWKSVGPDRWAVRANPSSGNLHPVEAWVVARGLPFLPDGVWHYRPDDHALECRATLPPESPSVPGLLLGLSSVMWREAWKYGERAFRYCQLDCGHGVAGLSYGAAALGWRLAEQPWVGHGTLARLLGLDRTQDFPVPRRGNTEAEEPEILLSLAWDGGEPRSVDAERLRAWAEQADFQGRASAIDPRPFYRWPVVDEIAAATRRGDGERQAAFALPPPPAAVPDLRPLGPVILSRRSAQRYDPARVMAREEFAGIMGSLTPVDGAPWDALAAPPRIDLLLFVHRVEGLVPGLYVLLRSAEGAALGDHLAGRFPVTPVENMPAGLRFLAPSDAVPLRRIARSLHCHQDLAANACFAAGMLAPLEDALAAGPAAYRDLYREAGAIGQALYLEAEARSLNGCGIGCFFDDPVHELAALPGSRWQSLYHFTVGRAVTDLRIETSAPYPVRSGPDDSSSHGG